MFELPEIKFDDRDRSRVIFQRLISKFNGGSTGITVFGFTFDMMNELEARLRDASDAEVHEGLVEIYKAMQGFKP